MREPVGIKSVSTILTPSESPRNLQPEPQLGALGLPRLADILMDVVVVAAVVVIKPKGAVYKECKKVLPFRVSNST